MRRGFTLIEVVVAIALLAALLGGLYAFVDGLRSNAKVADERAGQVASSEALLDEIENAMATTYVAGRDGAAGVAGEASSLSVRGRGWGFDENASDVVGCDVRVGGNGVEARRVVSGKTREWETIGGVVRVALRYHSGSEWVTTFDSARAGRLPSAIEVSMWFGPGAGEAGGSRRAAPDRVRVIAVHDAPSVTGGGL